MELRVFDKTVQPLGAIDELASMIWHTKYFDVGTFSLLAPITDNNSRLLVEGNLITKHDGKKEVKTADGGVWRRAAQITYVHITKDENGLEQLEAQGYMLSWWLNKRCIYPQIVATGTNQYLINLMVKNNCGSAAGTKRRFAVLKGTPSAKPTATAVTRTTEIWELALADIYVGKGVTRIQTVDTALQESKELLRLAHDLKYSAMNARHYGESCRKLKEIGVMLGELIEEVKTRK